MTIRIKPETIYALRDSTGLPFTDVMDRLIRHSVSVAAVSQHAVSTNARINYPDNSWVSSAKVGEMGSESDIDALTVGRVS